ncbi:hypothetical protein HX900_12290 [Rhizobium sp. WYCCWR 11290]|uniref:Uncharacterized protein n=1 Tax=Rhizobium changzhiense TaxID=2692317 RepID=A0A7Z0UCD5_9HYPH|nr:hypothetical protein [Rhizobium changzhiense]NZD61890.1 hypothetical protein [Rhizobium changzhiense]
MSAAGRALSRPELRTLRATAASTPTWWAPLSALPGKAARARDLFRLAEVRFDLHDTMFFEPTTIKQSAISFETGRRPVFCCRVSREKPIVEFPFGDRKSTNAKNGSPLTDAK